jgi:ATP-dependent DNA helicase RecG
VLHERKITENLKKQIKRLTDMGVVERVGRGDYALSRSFYEVTGRPSVHTQPIGLDRATCKVLVFKHIQNSGDKGAPLREIQQVLPNHSKNQVQYLLRDLLNEDKVFQKGSTTASRWFEKT